MLCAGEASGDLHASELIKALKARDPEARFCFLGGDLMAAAAGVRPAVHYCDMAYMGFGQVVRHLPDVTRNLDIARRLLDRLRPDVFIPVDYPSFNLRVASHAVSLGIPVDYYISPKVWAWKEHRVKAIGRLCRRVLSILPFEVEFYRGHGMEVDYVGNPSVTEMTRRLAAMPAAAEFRHSHGLPDMPVIALVPGSRRSEIESNLPVMAEAARVLGTKYQSVVGGAPGIEPEFYKGLTDLPVLYDCTTPLMAHATVALVTSGTATLECALIGTPQVICYRHTASRITYAVMSRVLKIPYVSLPNLIADREVVPELLMHKCTPLSVLRHIVPLLPGHEGRARQIEGYGVIRQRLGTADAAATAAGIIVGDLTPSTPQRPE